jgi:hypothetical protein
MGLLAVTWPVTLSAPRPAHYTRIGDSMFRRRIGPPPHDGNDSAGANSCPDIWELESGDFAIIGFDKTVELTPHLPAGAFVDPGERIVVLPRHVLVKARENIPDV